MSTAPYKKWQFSGNNKLTCKRYTSCVFIKYCAGHLAKASDFLCYLFLALEKN